ncbi:MULTISPECIES: hypothetical protein, partial [unclassified Leptolyngbya]
RRVRVQSSQIVSRCDGSRGRTCLGSTISHSVFQGRLNRLLRKTINFGDTPKISAEIWSVLNWMALRFSRSAQASRQ